MWIVAVLQEMGHFPAELAAWLDTIIRVEGEDWVRLEGMPPGGAVPYRLEQPEGRDGVEEETLYYHPKYMLLFFEEAKEVYRLMFLIQGPVPRPLPAIGDAGPPGRLPPP